MQGVITWEVQGVITHEGRKGWVLWPLHHGRWEAEGVRQRKGGGVMATTSWAFRCCSAMPEALRCNDCNAGPSFE